MPRNCHDCTSALFLGRFRDEMGRFVGASTAARVIAAFRCIRPPPLHVPGQVAARIGSAHTLVSRYAVVAQHDNEYADFYW